MKINMALNMSTLNPSSNRLVIHSFYASLHLNHIIRIIMVYNNNITSSSKLVIQLGTEKQIISKGINNINSIII